MSTLGERVKEVRQTAHGKKMTQEEFGSELGVSRDVISNIEYGRTKGDPELIIRAICTTFGVNETWLRTGEGEMLVPKTADQELAAVVGKLLREDNAEWYKKQLILAISDMKPETILDAIEQIKKRFAIEQD